MFEGAIMVLHKRLRRQTPHAHRPFEMIAALDGPFYYTDARGMVHQTSQLLIPPLARHAILDYEGRIARVYIGPGRYRLPGRGLRDMAAALSSNVVDRIADFFESERNAVEAADLIRDWRLCWLTDPDESKRCDPRVITILRYINDQMAPTADKRVVAALVDLSPSWFAALFSENVGMTPLRYMKWRRLLLAARKIREGASVTRAAHEAGFADNAHLTRSYRSAFGSAPSELQSIRFTHQMVERNP